MLHRVNHIIKGNDSYFVCETCNSSVPTKIILDNDHIGIDMDIIRIDLRKNQPIG